jgi:hypothetical protein
MAFFTTFAVFFSVSVDTKVAYYRRNRKDMYTKTIAREALQGAFVSWDKFEGFIASITQSLYSGAYIDEFKYTKALVAGAYENNKAIVEVVDAVTDDQTGKAFVKKARNLYKAMRFPSSNYNAYSLNTGDNKPVVTWTEPSRIVFMVRADVMTEVDVEVLASAFNMDKTDFLGRVIEVDKFDDAGKVQAIIADEAFFQIYDNIFRFDEFYNARVMAWNEYLHVWETFAICPFANAVILATEAPVVDATAIEADKATATVEAGEKVVVPFTVTPPNATTTVTASSSATSYATVEVKDKTVEISGVAEGSATITLGAGEGVTDTISVTVTA